MQNSDGHKRGGKQNRKKKMKIFKKQIKLTNERKKEKMQTDE